MATENAVTTIQNVEVYDQQTSEHRGVMWDDVAVTAKDGNGRVQTFLVHDLGSSLTTPENPSGLAEHDHPTFDRNTIVKAVKHHLENIMAIEDTGYHGPEGKPIKLMKIAGRIHVGIKLDKTLDTDDEAYMFGGYSPLSIFSERQDALEFIDHNFGPQKAASNA